MTGLKQNKKMMLAGWLLLSVLQLKAQNLDWSKINLAGPEAKILESASSQPAQDQQLITQSFDTKEGKITVYLPPLSSTITISGTVYLEPTNKDSSRNILALQSYRLNLGDQAIPVQRGSFLLNLPADPGPGTISLQLKNSGGQIIKNEQLPVTKAPVNSSGFIIPNYIVSGNAASIKGSFDGKLGNTSVNISGEKVQLLAESPSHLYFTSTGNHTGPSTVEVKENGKTQTATSNILKLDLSAPKTNLRRGEKTEIHITINGLEGLTVPVPLKIENTSPSVITLEGGNTQQITVVPRNDAPAGVFVTTRNIVSQKNGSFSVTVTIIPFSGTAN